MRKVEKNNCSRFLNLTFLASLELLGKQISGLSQNAKKNSGTHSEKFLESIYVEVSNLRKEWPKSSSLNLAQQGHTGPSCYHNYWLSGFCKEAEQVRKKLLRGKQIKSFKKINEKESLNNSFEAKTSLLVSLKKVFLCSNFFFWKT